MISGITQFKEVIEDNGFCLDLNCSACRASAEDRSSTCIRLLLWTVHSLPVSLNGSKQLVCSERNHHVHLAPGYLSLPRACGRRQVVDYQHHLLWPVVAFLGGAYRVVVSLVLNGRIY